MKAGARARARAGNILKSNQDISNIRKLGLSLVVERTRRERVRVRYFLQSSAFRCSVLVQSSVTLNFGRAMFEVRSLGDVRKFDVQFSGD